MSLVGPPFARLFVLLLMFSAPPRQTPHTVLFNRFVRGVLTSYRVRSLASPLINGRWELLYTTSESILGKSKPANLQPSGPIYQVQKVLGTAQKFGLQALADRWLSSYLVPK